MAKSPIVHSFKIIFLVCCIHGDATSVSPYPETQSEAEVKRVLINGNDKFVECFKNNDLMGALEIYSDDAKMYDMATGGVLSGKEELLNAFWTMTESVDRWKIHTIEVLYDGSNRAVWRGNSTLYRRDGSVMDSVKNIEIWGRGMDGIWRLELDLWNSNLPSVRSQIIAIFGELATALGSGDYNAAYKLFTEDSTYMPAQRPAEHGKGILEDFKQKCESRRCRLTLNNDVVAFDLGQTMAMLTGTLTFNDIHHKFCIVFTRVDGRWRFHMFMWSENEYMT